MNILTQKPARSAKAMLLQVSPRLFLATIGKSTFSERSRAFDQATYNKVEKAIKAGKPVPAMFYLNQKGMPTKLSAAQGLYTALVAQTLRLKTMPVYAFVVDRAGNVVDSSSVKPPRGFKAIQPEVVVRPTSPKPTTVKPAASVDAGKYADYLFWKFKPESGRKTTITDIKGKKVTIEAGQVFGSLEVRAGFKLLVLDNLRAAIIITPAKFDRLVASCGKVKKNPFGEAAPKVNAAAPSTPAVKPAPAPVVEQRGPKITRVAIPAQEDADDELVFGPVNENKVFQTQSDDDWDDDLMGYTRVSDLSRELHGFDAHDLGIDSESSVPESVSNSEGVSLSETYTEFLDKHGLTCGVDLDKADANSNMTSLISELFGHLSDAGFNTQVLKGEDYTKDLSGCCPDVAPPDSEGRSVVKHFVVNVNGVVLDPCHARLGNQVRKDVYPIESFKRLFNTVLRLGRPNEFSEDGAPLDVQGAPMSVETVRRTLNEAMNVPVSPESTRLSDDFRTQTGVRQLEAVRPSPFERVTI